MRKKLKELLREKFYSSSAIEKKRGEKKGGKKENTRCVHHRVYVIFYIFHINVYLNYLIIIIDLVYSITLE